MEHNHNTDPPQHKTKNQLKTLTVISCNRQIKKFFFTTSTRL